MSRLRQSLSTKNVNTVDSQPSKLQRRNSAFYEEKKPSIYRTTQSPLSPDDDDEYEEEFNFRPCPIGDPEDCLDVCKYQHIIYKCFREKEVERSKIRFNQTNFTLYDRNICVDQICRIHYKLGLTTNSFYRFIGMFDHFLTLVQIPKEKLMLYACATFLMASKMEDIFPAQSADLVQLAKRAFTQEDLFGAEIQVANAIKFSATFGTGLFFLTLFLRIEDEEDQDFHYFARFILEISQTCDFFYGKPFSYMASAAVYVTRFVWKQSIWTKKLEGYTAYTNEDLKPAFDAIRQVINNPERKESKFILRKYSCDLYHGVALIRF